MIGKITTDLQERITEIFRLKIIDEDYVNEKRAETEAYGLEIGHSRETTWKSQQLDNWILTLVENHLDKIYRENVWKPMMDAREVVFRKSGFRVATVIIYRLPDGQYHWSEIYGYGGEQYNGLWEKPLPNVSHVTEQSITFRNSGVTAYAMYGFPLGNGYQFSGDLNPEMVSYGEAAEILGVSEDIVFKFATRHVVKYSIPGMAGYMLDRKGVEEATFLLKGFEGFVDIYEAAKIIGMGIGEAKLEINRAGVKSKYLRAIESDFFDKGEVLEVARRTAELPQ